MLRDFLWGALYAAVAVLIAAAGLLWYSLGMPGRTYEGPLPQATAQEIELAARLKQHVSAIASEPHNIAHYASLEKAAQYIERTLEAAGYRVVSQPYEVAGSAVRNLEATIEPAESGPDAKTIVVGAHYDSIDDAPGANDNGSGAAAVLELARLLKDLRPAHTRLRLVLFVNEEPPYFQTAGHGQLPLCRAAGRARRASRGDDLARNHRLFFGCAGQPAISAALRRRFPNRGNFVAFVGMTGSRPLVREAMASFAGIRRSPRLAASHPASFPASTGPTTGRSRSTASRR